MAGIRNLYSELLRGRRGGTRHISSYTFFTGKDSCKNTPAAPTTTTSRQKGEESLHRRTHLVLPPPSLRSSSSYSIHPTCPNSSLPFSPLCPRRPTSSSCRKPLHCKHSLITPSFTTFLSSQERHLSPSRGFSSFYLPPVDCSPRQCLLFPSSCCSSCSPLHHRIAVRSPSSSLCSAHPGSSDREFRKERRDTRGFQSEASWYLSPSGETAPVSSRKCDGRARQRESQRGHADTCVSTDSAPHTSFSTTGETNEKGSTIHERESSCLSPSSYNGAYQPRHQDASQRGGDLTARLRPLDSSGRRDGGVGETRCSSREEKLSSDLHLDLRQQHSPRNRGEAEKDSLSIRNVQGGIGPGGRESSAGRGERMVGHEGASSSKIDSSSSPRNSSRSGGLPPPSPSPLTAPPTPRILRSKLSGPRAQLQVCIIEPVLETSPLPPLGEGLDDNVDTAIPAGESAGPYLKETKQREKSSFDQTSSPPLSPSLSNSSSDRPPSTTQAPSLVEEDGELFLRNMWPSSSSSPRTLPQNRVCRKLYYRCRYTSISRSQLATSLQLPYSDIRLVDVVRPPTVAPGPSTSSSDRGGEGPFSYSHESKKRPTHGLGVNGNSRHAFSAYEYLKRLFFRDSKSDMSPRDEGGHTLYQQKTSVKNDSSKGDEGWLQESTVEERERGCGEGGDLFGLRFENHLRDGPKSSIFSRSASDIGLGEGPFLTNLDALKLQHAKILVRRTAILVQIENIAAVLTPDRLLLLHPHPSVMSAILQQLSSDECTVGGGASSHTNNNGSSVYGGDYYAPRKRPPEGRDWGSSSRGSSDISSFEGSSSSLMESRTSSSTHSLPSVTGSTSPKDFKGIRDLEKLSGGEEDEHQSVEKRGMERQQRNQDLDDMKGTKENKIQGMEGEVLGMGNQACKDSIDLAASISSDKKKRKDRSEHLSSSSSLLERTSVLDENKQLSDEHERGMKTTYDHFRSSSCKSKPENQMNFSSSHSCATFSSCRLSPSTSSCLHSSQPAPPDTGGRGSHKGSGNLSIGKELPQGGTACPLFSSSSSDHHENLADQKTGAFIPSASSIQEDEKENRKFSSADHQERQSPYRHSSPSSSSPPRRESPLLAAENSPFTTLPRQLPFELRCLEAIFTVALRSLEAVAKDYVERVRDTIAALGEEESISGSSSSRRSSPSSSRPHTGGRTAATNRGRAWILATADVTLFTLLHTPSLHQLMVLKNLLQDVEARLDALRVCLTRLLSDDDDMADMYLTDKLVHTNPHAREDHADAELLLEGCLQQVDELLCDILTAKRCVIHHEELTKMHLDVCRNAYMQMNVKISLFSLTTSIAAVIAGIFGMNLPIWETSPTPPAQPVHERETAAPVVGDPYHRLDRYGEEQQEGKLFDKKKTNEERRSSLVDKDIQPIFDSRSLEATASSSSSLSRGAEDLLDSPSHSDRVSPVSRSFVGKSLEVPIPGSRGGRGESLVGRTAHDVEEDEVPGEDEATLVPSHRPSRGHAKQVKKTSTALSAPHAPVQDGVETDSERLTSTSAATASSSGAPLPLRPRSIMSQVTEKVKEQIHYSLRLEAIREEVFRSLRSVRDQVHTWFLDHAFGVVACAVVLPICLSGFLFCNQFARIFALHGCLKRSLSSGGGRFDTMRRSPQHLGRIHRLRILLSSYLFPSASSSRSALGHHTNNSHTFISRILKSCYASTSSSSSSSRSPQRGEVREVLSRDRRVQGSSSSSASAPGRPSSFSPVDTTIEIHPLPCSSPGEGGVQQKARTIKEGEGKEKTT